MATMNFDSTQVKDDFSPIPEGEYTAKITNSEWKVSKNNPDNTYFALTVTIIDGKYNGRLLFPNLNLKHPSEEVRGYAEKELKRICMATGIFLVKDSQDLHEIPFLIKLGLSADGLENKIKGYKPLTSGTTAAAIAAPAPVAAQKKTPWG